MIFACPAATHQIPTGKQYVHTQFMLDTAHIEQVSFEGNLRCVDEWQGQLGFATDEAQKNASDGELGRGKGHWVLPCPCASSQSRLHPREAVRNWRPTSAQALVLVRALCFARRLRPPAGRSFPVRTAQVLFAPFSVIVLASFHLISSTLA